MSLDYLIFVITIDNFNTTFTEILKTIPEKNYDLYIRLCQHIAETLKF